jgi:diacylglycerol kinase
MKNNPMHKRFLFGLAGFEEGIRRERSLRVHLGFSLLAVALLCALQPNALWWALLLFSLATGFGLELMNGALEALIDHLHPRRHPEIRGVKDMASGAVLAVNLGSIAIAATMVAEHVV